MPDSLIIGHPPAQKNRELIGNPDLRSRTCGTVCRLAEAIGNYGYTLKNQRLVQFRKIASESYGGWDNISISLIGPADWVLSANA